MLFTLIGVLCALALPSRIEASSMIQRRQLMDVNPFQPIIDAAKSNPRMPGGIVKDQEALGRIINRILINVRDLVIRGTALVIRKVKVLLALAHDVVKHVLGLLKRLPKFLFAAVRKFLAKVSAFFSKFKAVWAHVKKLKQVLVGSIKRVFARAVLGIKNVGKVALAKLKEIAAKVSAWIKENGPKVAAFIGRVLQVLWEVLLKGADTICDCAQDELVDPNAVATCRAADVALRTGLTTAITIATHGYGIAVAPLSAYLLGIRAPPVRLVCKIADDVLGLDDAADNANLLPVVQLPDDFDSHLDNYKPGDKFPFQLDPIDTIPVATHTPEYLIIAKWTAIVSVVLLAVAGLFYYFSQSRRRKTVQ